MNSNNIKGLPVKDSVFSGVIISITLFIIANLYDLLLVFIYAKDNLLTLVFLGWLYRN